MICSGVTQLDWWRLRTQRHAEYYGGVDTTRELRLQTGASTLYDRERPVDLGRV